MNKLSISKHIAFIGGALASFVISLIYFIKSYSYYADEYGTDISFNKNYVIALVVSLILLSYASYKLYAEIKTKEVKYDAIIGVTCSSLVSFYSLGTFFKAWTKALSKKKTFDFNANQVYLYIGIIVLFLSAYFLIKVLEQRKAK